MADAITLTLDSSGCVAALEGFAVHAVQYTKPASKITADNIQREARSRVARATGQTAEHILVSEIEGGYLVHTSDVRLDRTPIPGKTKQRSALHKMKHVGLWLEKGIRQGKPGSHTAAPRPFFFVSAQLEMGAHERRIDEALQQAAAAEGLGS